MSSIKSRLDKLERTRPDLVLIVVLPEGSEETSGSGGYRIPRDKLAKRMRELERPGRTIYTLSEDAMRL